MKATEEGRQMIGYSLRINELKGRISRRLIADVRYRDYPEDTKLLRAELQGEPISHSESVTPWWSVGRLIEAVETGTKLDGTLVYGGGYPFLFTALGRHIISEISDAEGSQHGELRDLIDPQRIYFIEAWDLS